MNKTSNFERCFCFSLSVSILLLFSLSCSHMKPATEGPRNMNQNYSPAWPHGALEQIFDNVFMVTGTNIISFDGVRIQDSVNMVVIRQEGELTLINTVRMDGEGLKALEGLGRVKNIIRLGGFHGRHDAFYQDRYGAKLWAIPSMEFSHGEKLNFDISTASLPVDHLKALVFQTTQHPEAVLLLEREGGVLISCDSIKNWTKKDRFFDRTLISSVKSEASHLYIGYQSSIHKPKAKHLKEPLKPPHKHNQFPNKPPKVIQLKKAPTISGKGF